MPTPTWDDICKTVDSYAKKAGRKVEEFSESAAIRLKISATKAELEEEYTKLGELTYDRMYNATESSTPQTDADIDVKIADCVAQITALRREISSLQAKINH